MLDELKYLLARLRVRWQALVAALVLAAPSLLLYLDGIDMRPILAYVLPDNYVELIAVLLPLVLAVMRPMVHLEAPEDDE